MHLFMGAQAVGREIAVIGAAIDGEGAPAMVEADDVLFVDVVCRAGLDPVAAHVACSQRLTVIPPAPERRCRAPSADRVLPSPAAPA